MYRSIICCPWIHRFARHPSLYPLNYTLARLPIAYLPNFYRSIIYLVVSASLTCVRLTWSADFEHRKDFLRKRNKFLKYTCDDYSFSSLSSAWACYLFPFIFLVIELCPCNFLSLPTTTSHPLPTISPKSIYYATAGIPAH
jgi:hypothetical protein